MITGKNRVRIVFAPLSVAVSMECATPNSSLVQVWNALLGEYEPDRTLSPTELIPIVLADATDGSWTNKRANRSLANMKWLEDGVDISTIKEWKGLYDVATEGDKRGSITIRRNVSQGKSITLTFEADLVDDRTGTLYHVVSDPVTLSAVTKARDTWHICLLDSPTQEYNPAADRLAEYEYCLAHGLKSDRANSRKEATDGRCYLRAFPFIVYQGENKVTSGFTMSYWRINIDRSMTRLDGDSDEVVSMDNGQLTLDLRFIASATYLAMAEAADGTFLAQSQFSVTRVYPQMTFRTSNGTSLEHGDDIRHDTAMVDAGADGIVRYPEHFIKMTWMTDSPAATGVAHNEGRTGRLRLKNSGVNLENSDDWLDTYLDVNYKPAHCVATDENGNIFTDENGDEFFFN